MSDTTAAHPVPRASLLERLLAARGVAILRLAKPDSAMHVIEALQRGGVFTVEVTMTTPGAFAIIEEAAACIPEVLIGVGSVLDSATARRAVDAGARFVVSPVFREDVVLEAHRLGVPAGPGAFTPTEILRAHDAGADVVKLFPSDVLGPAFLKGVLAAMPFLRLMPTGGVTPDNAGDWLRAGAAAVGLGSSLVDPALVDAGDFAEITARARRLAESITAARPERATRERPVQ